MPAPQITLSVVSHRQNALVNELLEDVRRVCADRVVLMHTENVRDTVPLATARPGCPVEVLVNDQRKGFGANHNAAFRRSRTPYFCVCNPDVRLRSDPFPALLAAFADLSVGVVGPLVRSPDGRIEDSARRFPTPWTLLKKAVADRREPDYPTGAGVREVDWIAGMFMLFRSDAFRAVSGFDEAYFLYYEDADICRRLRRAGRSVLYVPGSEIVHDARRASRRDLAHARHHLASALRFFLSAD